MCIRSQIIILLTILLFSCEKLDNHQHPPSDVDSVLIKSIENTNTFTLIIEDVDSVELELWASIGFKIDSLIKRNRKLEINCNQNWRPRIVDKDGNVKILPPISDLKKKK
jgi:hypothetical protein